MMRSRMVTVICFLSLGACASKPIKSKNADSAPQTQSLSWPVVVEKPQTGTPKPAQVKMEAEEKPVVQTASFTKPDPRRAPPSHHPQPIRIPKARSDEALDHTFESETPLIFDIPVAYNARVKYWIEFFQTNGRGWYTKWLERSSRWLPVLQRSLKKNGLPQDLAYMAMIESGFSPHASSTAQAVGPWQFIRETGQRYGLKINWWLDERRDFQKSTDAAAKYMKKMYGMFHNWYLVAAGYNTGENRIKRAIEKRRTKSFWKIAQNKDIELETRDYVPKLIAAMLIAKSPQMYGFKNLNYHSPLSFEHFRVPGGTYLSQLAESIGVTTQTLTDLNPELVKGYVPEFVEGHLIRIPKGSSQLVSHFVRRTFVSGR